MLIKKKKNLNRKVNEGKVLLSLIKTISAPTTAIFDYRRS